MDESLRSGGMGLRRIRFRCAKCGAAVTAGLGAGPTVATCGYCGSANVVPRGLPGRAVDQDQPVDDGARIPPRVAHEPYLDELRSLAGSSRRARSSAETHSRAQAGRRWRIAGLVIANAAAACLTLAVIGRAVGWW